MSAQRNFTKYIASEAEMLAFGKTFANAMSNGLIVYLNGPLGAGKTTLVRGILRGFEYQDKVKSPTYTLVESYELPNKKIYHFDFYRLNDANELLYIGINEYFATGAICLIEWPEKGGSILPPADLVCHLSFAEKARNIQIEALSSEGSNVLQLLQKQEQV